MLGTGYNFYLYLNIRFIISEFLIMKKMTFIFSKPKPIRRYYITKTGFLLLVVISVGSPAFASTYYLSPSGKDSYSSSKAQNQATPWKTFAKAFGAMSGGDELILLDGTYSIANDTGCINFQGSGSGQPPSGSSKSSMTLVRALNPGSVFIDGTGDYENIAIFIGRKDRVDSYIEIRGITAYGGIHLYNSDYSKIKTCGSRGGIGIGTNDHAFSCDYNLIEDCWVWAKGSRIIAGSYEGRYNIWRRIVIRGDGCNTADCNGSGNPNVGITVYNSQSTLLENVIVIDRILNGGEPYGDFTTAQHSGGANDYSLTGNQWLGCISINSEDIGYHFEGDIVTPPSHYIRDCIVICDTLRAGFNLNGDAGVIIESSSVFSLNGSSSGVFFRHGDSSTGQVIRNIIGYAPSANYAIIRGGITSYTDTYAESFYSNRYYATSINVGEKTSNPLNDGNPKSVLYPIRIELGSVLKGTGYAGVDYGANVLYKYGLDGTFYGDTGYDILTSTPLWPWPNEDRIQTEMSSNYGSQNEKRGFCAIGKQLDGTTSITLTSYIWEYLGNKIPNDIYKNSKTIDSTFGGGVLIGNP
jgi:hypothetical protein